MTEIITDIEKLAKAAAPLQFITPQGVETEEGEGIIKALKDTMEADKTLLALAAPQIGIDSRIFCVRFNDTIKTFINPIVTKKANYVIKPETFVSMPGKEILITRPEEVTVVYYTDDFKYEENKLLGIAARLFDQHCQLLDGILPSELGLVSDVAEDGSLADLTEEEATQIMEIYKQYISVKTETLKKGIKDNPELEAQYKSLSFAEKVINGSAAVVVGDGKEQEKQFKKARREMVASAKKADGEYRRQKLNQFLKKKRK